MQTPTDQQQEAANQVYAYTANLLVTEKRTPEDVIENLTQQGISQETASEIVFSLQGQIADAKKKAANNDMLYGALWCIGGTIATMADIGFIFWGAIVFGGFQFFKGLFNSMQ